MDGQRGRRLDPMETSCQWEIHEWESQKTLKNRVMVKSNISAHFEVNCLSLTHTFNKFCYTQRFLSPFVM